MLFFVSFVSNSEIFPSKFAENVSDIEFGGVISLLHFVEYALALFEKNFGFGIPEEGVRFSEEGHRALPR